MFSRKFCVTATASLICSLAAAWQTRSPLSSLRLSSAAGIQMNIEKSTFLNAKLAMEIKTEFQTPVFVYDEKTLTDQAKSALAFPNNYGLTVRFAMKACPNAAILQLFSGLGLHFDASSGYEVQRAVLAGIHPSHISLSSQEFPQNFKELYDKGLEVNLCSLDQIEKFGKLFPGGKCGIRFNPGRGSGGTGKTNVGGPSSSFGIWYELQDEVKALVSKYGLKVVRIHTHIGSGSDPAVWQEVAQSSLNLVRAFPDVTVLNLGGGYKVGRMSNEKSTNLQEVGAPVKVAFEKFAVETGRKLKLEIEPGTFLVANSGALLSTVQDMVTTGKDGHTFLKLDAGMAFYIQKIGKCSRTEKTILL
jgi:diaminopimelate decarboxylase